MIRAEHRRSSIRLGNTAEVWCRCGWRVEFRAFSGDAASRRIIAEWESHMAGLPVVTGSLLS